MLPELSRTMGVPTPRPEKLGPGNGVHDRDRRSGLVTREEFAALASEVQALRSELEAVRQRETRARGRGRLLGAAGTAALVAGLLLVGGRPGVAQKPPPPVGTVLKAPVTVLGNNGRTIMSVTPTALGGHLVVFDQAGRKIAQISDEPGERGFHTFDAAGVESTFAGTAVVGPFLSREVSVANEQGAGVAAMAHAQADLLGIHGSGFQVIDDDGHIRTQLGFEEGIAAGLQVNDPDEHPLARLGAFPLEGLHGLGLFGSAAQGYGLQAAVQSATAVGGAIALFKPDGSPSFNAPP